MATEQDLDKLRDIVRKLCDDYPEFGIFLIASADNDDNLPVLMSGNRCPVCALQYLMALRMSGQIDHTCNDNHNGLANMNPISDKKM